MRKLLLVIPFAGTLLVPLYNFQQPALWGFPFFYWYLFGWVPLASLLTWIAYRNRPR